MGSSRLSNQSPEVCLCISELEGCTAAAEDRARNCEVLLIVVSFTSEKVCRNIIYVQYTLPIV